MTNPFDVQEGEFRVLVNARGQHCLWPAVVATPAGWDERHGPASRPACLEYVTAHWTDIRPLDLVAQEAGAER